MNNLGVTPILSSYISETCEVGLFKSTIIGSIISSVIFSAVSHPFDTIKTNLQGDLSKFNKNRKSFKMVLM